VSDRPLAEEVSEEAAGERVKVRLRPKEADQRLLPVRQPVMPRHVKVWRPAEWPTNVVSLVLPAAAAANEGRYHHAKRLVGAPVTPEQFALSRPLK
jgi:hypothetical protein